MDTDERRVRLLLLPPPGDQFAATGIYASLRASVTEATLRSVRFKALSLNGSIALFGDYVAQDFS